MNRLSFLLLLLGACASLAAAASAPTFCKCTCFTNSTIIEIKSTTPGSLPGSHQVEAPLPPDTDSSSEDDDTSPPSSDDDDNNNNNDDDDTLTHLHRRSHPPRAPTASPSCSQCNRAFCLAQSLPICKGADEKDVVTMCFQRDSTKDQIIVWGFLLGTAGLLGWAAVRKVLERQAQHRSGLAGALLGGSGGVPVGRVGAGAGGGAARRAPAGLGGAGGGGTASGVDGGRGQYVSVAGHSRENTVL